MKKLLIIFSAILLSSQLSAQCSGDIYLMSRAREVVFMLNDYVSFMTGRDITMKERQEYKKLALRLFLGGGGEYLVNGQKHSAVQVEITNITASGQQRKIRNATKVWLERMLHLSSKGRRIVVAIDSVAIFAIVGEPKQISDSLFEVMYRFRPDLLDEKILCVESDTVKVIWEPRLCEEIPSVLIGDIKVTERTFFY